MGEMQSTPAQEMNMTADSMTPAQQVTYFRTRLAESVSGLMVEHSLSYEDAVAEAAAVCARRWPNLALAAFPAR